MADKGIKNPYQYLVKSGFTYFTAYRLLNNRVANISYKHLEQLCIVLHCTIDELFAWSPPENMQNANTHPLQKLIPQQNKTNIIDDLKQLPLDKINEIRKFINQIK